ncbi:MAG: adenylyl-sulfate kinase [Reyranella sp.]|uniref:adenylyl-sulfate kinase n=1 Tax=Reyranella sp. TaxID=1929291 RepID=UPI001AC8AF60|nr:adenylyl-sulfate kinase [Reyranella sp.]MBN9088320.1 adenylyl-sulfate kinase [Reyranella sp.]
MDGFVDRRSTLRFLACGSVDDGKSTLIGRLIADSAGLLDDQRASLVEDSRRFGTTGDDMDFALLLDGLEAEREQGITIDVAHRFFSTPRRAFVVADTPGHRQLTRNMATGASTSELAVLLVDIRNGLVEQTRRHAAIAHLLGIRHVVVAVNKIDLVDFSEHRFREVERAVEAFAKPLALASLTVIPVSARHGDNVATRSARTPWYDGPSLLACLETIDVRPDNAGAPLRFPVQWVNRPDASFRGFAGTVMSGEVSVGAPVAVAGSGRITRVERIVSFDGDLPDAAAGRAVTLTLADEIDIARGDLLIDPRRRPTVTRQFAADLVWLAEAPAQPRQSLLLKIGTATVPATLTRIVDRLDLDSLGRTAGDDLALNAIGRVWIETTVPVAFDPYADNRATGGFILIDRATARTAAAGLAVENLAAATNVHPQIGQVTPARRAAMKGQRPLVLWLTGLPGAGKSTIADLVERKLVEHGRQTMLLDGDNLRQGINSDLGFDSASRAENVRRVGEIARLMADAGLIAIVALVSPFRADRLRAASLLPAGSFVEIFVDTPIEVCRQRDTKGLHALADKGRLANLTGRDQPYEPPEQPALVLKTTELSAQEAADRVVALVLDRV